MSDFSNRPRFKLGEILKYLHENPSNAICHILSNDDGTYSMMYHIVCEHCDHCDSQGDCRDIFQITKIDKVKENPYEEIDKYHAELESYWNWYGEHFKYAFGIK